jgi:hypothetical protein
MSRGFFWSLAIPGPTEETVWEWSLSNQNCAQHLILTWHVRIFLIFYINKSRSNYWKVFRRTKSIRGNKICFLYMWFYYNIFNFSIYIFVKKKLFKKYPPPPVNPISPGWVKRKGGNSSYRGISIIETEEGTKTQVLFEFIKRENPQMSCQN